VAQDWRDELIAELRRENAELKQCVFRPIVIA
jgi:hypothetical protein